MFQLKKSDVRRRGSDFLTFTFPQCAFGLFKSSMSVDVPTKWVTLPCASRSATLRLLNQRYVPSW